MFHSTCEAAGHHAGFQPPLMRDRRGGPDLAGTAVHIRAELPLA